MHLKDSFINISVRTKAIYQRSVYVLFSLLIAVSTATTAYASQSFTSYPTPSTHTSPGDVKVIDGDFWYKYGATSASPYSYKLARMTPSGSIMATYDLRTLTGYSNLEVRDITAGPDGNVWFGAFTGAPRVGKLDIATGTAVLYGTAGISGYFAPKGVMAGPDGNIWYIAQHQNNKHSIVRVNPATGVVTEVYYNDDTYGQWSTPSMTNDGKLWFTDSFYKRLYTYNTLTGSWSTQQLPQLPISITSISGFISGPDGNVWSTGSFTNAGVTEYKILKRDSGGVFTEYILPAGMRAASLTVGADGAIWFANSGDTKTIGRITTSGTISTYPAPTGTSAISNTLLGPDGAIWYNGENGSGKYIGRLGY